MIMHDLWDPWGLFACGYIFLSLELGSLAVVGLIWEFRKYGLKKIVFGVHVYENYIGTQIYSCFSKTKYFSYYSNLQVQS